MELGKDGYGDWWGRDKENMKMRTVIQAGGVVIGSVSSLNISGGLGVSAIPFVAFGNIR